MTTHLLVTNDFPPKVGGIQSYLWELWRRLDPATYAVLTASSHRDADVFDATLAAGGIRVERVPGPILYFPTPRAGAAVRAAAGRVGAGLVVYDPVLPLGLLGRRLGLPYAVVLHGAEVAVPSRLAPTRPLLASVLGRASLVVSAGGYPAAEAARATGGRLPPVVEVPPGVDCERFRPASAAERARARRRLGLPLDAQVVASVSRLVPRKGMDVLIAAAAMLAPAHPKMVVAIAGTGRDRPRLDRLAAGVPRGLVRLLGRVGDDDKVALLQAADVFVMACRSRWRGLEEEGFGIVFLEAAACGVPQVAGRSGGAAEAVDDGRTGLVVDRPEDPGAVAAALGRLLDDDVLRLQMGQAARRRTQASFDYARLAPRLAGALQEAHARMRTQAAQAGHAGPGGTGSPDGSEGVEEGSGG